MSDTLSDTDWTAKSTERDVDKSTSSTTNRSHSPPCSLNCPQKSQSKIRPSAIGESFSRILASLVFNRIGKKAKEFFSPFQFGIKTIDGASSAALSSEVFFNSSDSNDIFNLDFKNAFNSVSRSSILPLLQKHFPEVEPFFYSFYGKSSTLVCENFDLLSSSGVKQGDPLGPCFFFTKPLFNANKTLKKNSISSIFLRSRIFCGTNSGGVDFHKSSHLCKAALIGGGKNFICEFVYRFPEKMHLIENCGSSYLISLQQEIETLSPNIWAKCFPSDIVELPSRSLLSLPLTFAKLQKKILKVLENLDYIVRLGLVKEKKPVFANFLIDLEDSCSSCLIS
ncbi:hypothetical protein P9112_013776 [Eukaryota sp. TZLM1-RC]